MELEPCIVFSSGILGTGKTTTMKEFSKTVENAFYIDRDDLIQGMLHIPVMEFPGLIDFKDYVANDGIFPNHARTIETLFGEMIKLDPTNDSEKNSNFYGRHMRDQSYLVQLYLAKTNLELGKIPVIDCITMRQIQDRTLERIKTHPFLRDFNKFHFHFVVDEGEGYKRYLRRVHGEEGEEDRKRYPMNRNFSREEFHKFITEEQPMSPKELENYEHLVVDTTEASLEDCAKKCIEYISR